MRLIKFPILTAETLSVNRFTGDHKSVAGQEKVIEDFHEMYLACGGDCVPLTMLLRRAWRRPGTARNKLHPGAAHRLLRAASRAVTAGLKVTSPAERVSYHQEEFCRYSA